MEGYPSDGALAGDADGAVARRLWLYWETPKGKTVPAYIALCKAAIEHRCRELDIRIVNPSDLSTLLPDIHPNIHRVTTDADLGTPTLAVKTGFIRTFLLARYGGLYVDIDSLPMAPFDPIYTAIQTHGFVAVRRTTAPKRHVSIGLLGAAPDNRVITAYAKELQRLLQERYLFKWGEIGAWSLTPIVEQSPDACLMMPEDVAHPVVAEHQYKFMSKTLEPDDVMTENTLTAMLFHRPFSGPSKAVPELGLDHAPYGWLRNWSIKDLYSSDILLSKLFRRSLPEHAFAGGLDAMNRLVSGASMTADAGI